ncbi:GumC family protein [Dickeya chrysanthemi]|uniref:GumC family protein n=1 Tax=Dickeya chrysanthemi TaxID=556 RepID=UPI00039E6A53|nr:exopolysaccharide transport family protein [Dickeya chrysanthemi]MBX9445919.1 capsular biosynthesis protein [Dickeya chrysanthemi]MCA7009192.1 exopolysaccharide transport family protein [Dickeya chrysanthemi]
MSLSIVENGKKLESTIDFSRFARELKKNGWKVILSGVIAAVAAYPLISMITPKYVSTATVLLKAQQDNVSPLPQVDSYDSTRSGYYETQYALMQSRIVLEQAVRDVHLYQNNALGADAAKYSEDTGDEQQQVERTLKAMLPNLTINGVRTTHLATITYESASPALSAEVANGVAQAFINYTAKQKHLKTLKASALNQKQMEEVWQQVVDQQAAIDQFLKREGLLTFRGVDGFETEQLGIVTTKLADATQRRIAAETNYNSVRLNAGKPLENVISLPDISNHAQIQDLRIALIQARRSLYDLRKRYGMKHTKILEAEAQVQAIEEQTRTVLLELESGLNKQYQAALRDEKYYQQLLNQQKAAFQMLVSKRDEYNNLTTTLEKTKELYKALYQRAKEQALAGNYLEPDAVLYDPAVPADRPSKPNKAMLLVMVVMLTLIFSVVYFIVKAALDNSINNISQMKKRLHVTPVGEIRNFANGLARKQVARLITESPLYADIVHSMRTHILLSHPSCQVIGMGSTEQGEGRSLLAHVLATSFSADQKTLLIDLDFFNGNGLTQDLAPPAAIGVAELLSDLSLLESALVPISENLSFLPRGQAQMSSLLMLSSEQIVTLMAALRARYQRIVIDVAAANQAQDIQLVNRVIDGLMFVLKAGAWRTGEVLSALEKVQHHQAVLIGAVLNRVTDKNLETKEGIRSLNHHMTALINSTGHL